MKEEPLGPPGRWISAGWCTPKPPVNPPHPARDPGPISVPGSSLAQPHPAWSKPGGLCLGRPNERDANSVRTGQYKLPEATPWLMERT
jgi:hypothetical protein